MRPDLDLRIKLPRVPHFLEFTTYTIKKNKTKKELIHDTHTKITEKLKDLRGVGRVCVCGGGRSQNLSRETSRVFDMPGTEFFLNSVKSIKFRIERF